MTQSNTPQAAFSGARGRVPRQVTLYDDADLPAGTTRDMVTVVASDGAGSWGFLHDPPGGSDTCAVLMHPRGNQARPYVAPALLHAGIAVFGANSRYLGNDSNTTHEELALDIAAGMRMLRDRGYERIVLIGNSGGGSLLGYYQAQAARRPEDRQKVSPAGDPTGFEHEDMPTADFFIGLAAHQGEGRILLKLLDPAVVDEEDPIQTDPALDMYDPANGYRPFPEPSTYDREWLAGYRAAQIERCRRLDSIARSRLAVRREAEAVVDPEDTTSALARQALLTRYMVIYRTIANPAHLDPTIDPSGRGMGTIFVPGNPIRGNYAAGALSRVMTPRAWLSTWSGLSSAADLTQTIREITLPTLLVSANGDKDIFPGDQDELLDLSASSDKSLVTVDWAGHYLLPTDDMPADAEHPRIVAGNAIVDWLRARS